MPLPTGDRPWPPAEPALKRVTDDLTVADAWWSGDPNLLAAVYGGTTAGQAQERQRPSQRIRDAFWGRQVADQARAKERLHVPAAADVAATGADLLFGGDDLRLQVPDAHGDTPDPDAKKAEEAITALADRIGLASTLLEAAELAGALGGVFLRPSWDPTASDDPILWVIHPDRAIPEWRMGQLVAVTVWSVVEDAGQVVWRHLERHEYIGTGPDRRPIVLHGLYVGTSDKLGSKVALAKHPATVGIAADDDGLGYIPDGVTRLLVSYVPNALPNRRHRHNPVGRPDTQGAEPLMGALDKTMTSWMRDLDLGQRRIIVPDQYLQKGPRGSGSGFDVDQEVFSPLSIEPNPNRTADTIEVVDFALRVDEHEKTARFLFERIVASARYSPQSFGVIPDGGAMTATEVNAKENRSERTTKAKRRYWNPVVPEVAFQLACIEADVFDRGDTPVAVPRLVWPDLDGTDLGDLAATVEVINRAAAASTETKVRMLHPDWEPQEIADEATKIRADEGLGVDDPTGGFP